MSPEDINFTAPVVMTIQLKDTMCENNRFGLVGVVASFRS